MNKIQYQEINDKKMLLYNYADKSELDEVILQLINEETQEGFIRNQIDSEHKCVKYDITDLVSLEHLSKKTIEIKDLMTILQDFYQKLICLEDAFIDRGYMMLDYRYVYMHIDTQKLYFIVLPNIDQDKQSMTVFIKQLIHCFDYEDADQGCVNELLEAVNQGVYSISDLDNLIQILKHYDDYMDILFNDWDKEIEETDEEQQISSDILQEEFSEIEENDDISVDLFKQDDLEAYLKEELIEKEQVFDDLEQDASFEEKVEVQEETVDFYSDDVLEESSNENSVIEDEKVYHFTEEEMAALLEEYKTQLLEEFQKNTKDDSSAEVNTETITEQQEKETAVKPVQKSEKYGYLVCKKNGEIISLQKDTMVFGKDSVCCDYWIMNNPTVSRIHAIIRRDENGVYSIVDCHSTNHTYLNGHELKRGTVGMLTNQMCIHMSTEAFIFYAAE